MDVAFEHIMIATDLTETSYGAVRAAELLATGFGARVTLWHGCEPPVVLQPTAPLMAAAPPTQGVITVREEQAKKALDELRLGPLGRVGDVVTKTVVTSSIASSICSAAEEDGVDLLIVGTDKRVGVLARMMMGTVAERVVRHAECSVLVVPADGSLAGGRLRRVDVATDLSEPALAAADVGHWLATRFDARCTLVNVIVHGAGAPAGGNYHGDFMNAWSLEARSETLRMRRSELQALAQARFGEEAMEVEAMLAPAAHDAMVQRAMEHEVDVVVVGTVGRTGLRRMLLGSVAEKIVRACPCAVLVAR